MEENAVNPNKVVIAIDSSTFSIIETCHYKAKLLSIDNWQSTEPLEESIDKGSVIHEMLEAYYRAMLLKNSQEDSAIADKYRKLERSEIIKNAMLIGKIKAVETNLGLDVVHEVASTFFDYCQHYANELWQPESVEQFFSFPIYDDGEVVILWEGKIDLIVTVRQGSELIRQVVDHKSTSRTKVPHPLNNQFQGYATAMKASMVVKNEIVFRKTGGFDEKFRRHVLSYPQYMLDQWRDNTIEKVLDFYAKVKAGRISQNFNNCDKWGKFCQFTLVCACAPQAREWKLNSMFKRVTPEEKWSPVKTAKDRNQDPFAILETVPEEMKSLNF